MLHGTAEAGTRMDSKGHAQIGATGRVLQFSRRHEHNGVAYTISNDADGTVRWAFDVTVEAPFRGTTDTPEDAHEQARMHIDRLRRTRP